MIWTLRFLEALHLSPLYKWVYETASKDSFVSIEKAERLLGYAPKYSNKDALVRNYRWYIEHLDQFEHSSRGCRTACPGSRACYASPRLFSKATSGG